MKKTLLAIAVIAAVPALSGAQTTMEAVADAKVAGPIINFGLPGVAGSGDLTVGAVADAKVAGPFIRGYFPGASAIADAKVAGASVAIPVSGTAVTADGRVILDLNAAK